MEIKMSTHENDGVKCYTKKELADLYELSTRAFHTMFKRYEEEVGKKAGRYYSIAQVQLIFSKLGKPASLLKDEFVPSTKKIA
ncbi:MAG: hypothetical protein ACJ77K_06485 [Bacteroidia bacterium]